MLWVVVRSKRKCIPEGLESGQSHDEKLCM